MTILVELDPETEARLNAEANGRGIEPAQFVREFLRDNLPLVSASLKLTATDLAEMTKVMTQGSELLPILPPEVNERASYYEDRW